MTVHAPHAMEVIERVTERLTSRFRGVADDETIRALVIDSYRRYRHLDHPSAHARSLAAQLAADRLTVMRRCDSPPVGDGTPSFLFICSGNAGRSQLAAAMLRAVVSAPILVMSGGETPAARILPPVIEILDELGVPLFGEYPKPVTPEFVAAADEIVVLNCDDRLEMLDGHAFRTWTFSVDGTSGKSGMRYARDQIAEAVRGLAEECGLEPAPL